MTIANSNANLNFNDGGGINNSGNLAVNDCVLSANNANRGGGIYFDGEYGGTLKVVGSTFSGNSGAMIEGGGIFYNGSSGGTDSLIITNCVFSADVAAEGAGIFISRGTTTINGSSFAGNTVGCAISNGDSLAYTGGKLTVTNSAISGNTGGAICNNGGTVLVTSTTISGNSTDFGAGIDNAFGTLTIIDSTVFGNSAYRGGGIYNNQGVVNVTNSTITGNVSSNGGGGIYQDGNSLQQSSHTTLVNSIVAENHNATFPDIYSDAYSSLAASYCLIGDASGSSGLTNGINRNQVGTAASPPNWELLGPLANNGGPTMPDGTTMLTVAPLPGSPAIDAGSNALAQAAGVTQDQRGLPRPWPVNGTVDIGAYEYQSAAPGVTTVSSTTATGIYGAGTVIPITVTFSEAVNVSGTPQLTLNDGAVVNYTSGSGSATLTFDYTVAAGQNTTDLDYASIGALTVAGASIKDSGDNAVVLTLPATGTDGLAAKNIVINTTPATYILGADFNADANTASWSQESADGRSFLFIKAAQGDNTNSFLPSNMSGAPPVTNSFTFGVFDYADPDEYANPSTKVSDPNNSTLVATDARQQPTCSMTLPRHI